MLIMACVALFVLLVPLTGGRLSGLARLSWKRPWLLLVALLTQVVVLEIPGLPETFSAVVHVLTYVAAAAFVLLNRQVRGLVVVAVGAASNGLVIALNGGTLPASAAAQRTAGIEVSGNFVNSGVLQDPTLGFLGDVFAVPSWVPLANVFSVGDVLIVAGAGWVIWAATRRRAAHRASTPAAAPVAVGN